MTGEVFATHLAFTVIATGAQSVRATIGRVEILALAANSPVRVTQFSAEVLLQQAGRVAVTEFAVEVLARTQPPCIPYVEKALVQIWTIPPNWQTGVTERLAWKTDVLTSIMGIEQRRALRAAPRLVIEANYLVFAKRRRVLDAFLMGPGAALWRVPMWWERYTLDQSVTAGEHRIYSDVAFSQFQVGDTLMLLDSNARYDCATVKAVFPDHLDLIHCLRLNWPEGAAFYNTRICRLTGKVDGKRQADDDYDIKLTFDSQEPEIWPAIRPPVGDPNLPFQTQFRLNYLASLSSQYSRLYAEFDNDIGKRARRDIGQQAFVSQAYEYSAFTRKAAIAFRSFLYFLQGKLKPIYLPTHFQDFELPPGGTIEAGASNARFVATGIADYLGANTANRKFIAFFFRDGTIIGKAVTAVVHEGVGFDGVDTEVVSFLDPMPVKVTFDNLLRACWLQVMRQDTDDFNILHETDSGGATKFSTVFRSIGSSRVSIHYELVFSGTYIKEANPPVLPVDIQRAGGTDRIVPAFYPEERWTPEVAGGGGGSDDGNNSDGAGEEGSEL